MRTKRFFIVVISALYCTPALADFTLSFDSADFTISSNFNDVASFHFDITVASNLVPGGVYVDPPLDSVDYSVQGILMDPTPSGFSHFNLVRSISGLDFYGLSPNATLSFTLRADADLSDGLQMNELAGAGLVFVLNARELDQDPGRYHPPIFTLNADGTGRLVNADNESIYPNPPPPMGSGMLVNVEIGDEYDVDLAFDTELSIADPVPAPVPLPVLPVLLAIPAIAWAALRDLRRQRP